MNSISALFLLLSASTLWGEAFIDTQAFFASRSNQVFQAGTARAFKRGLVKGAEETIVLSWEGTVDGQSLTVEIEKEHLRLITTNARCVLRFRQASALRSELWSATDANNAELYVMDGQGKWPGILCLEAFAQDVHRSTPDKEGYVVVDPIGHPRLYRMPRRHASALGLVRLGEGTYGLPCFTRRKDATGWWDIRYYRLAQHHLETEGRSLTIQYLAGDSFRFNILP